MHTCIYKFVLNVSVCISIQGRVLRADAIKFYVTCYVKKRIMPLSTDSTLCSFSFSLVLRRPFCPVDTTIIRRVQSKQKQYVMKMELHSLWLNAVVGVGVVFCCFEE